MGSRDLEKFDFSRGRWGMTQVEVMTHEISEFVRLQPGELYYDRDLLGYPAQTKYCFSPSGGLWSGIYRIASTHHADRVNAFNALRRGNVRGHGPPTWVIKTLPNGSHTDMEVVAALSEDSTTWNGEWGWRFANMALFFSRFELHGALEVWLAYVSEPWIRAYRAGELPDEGPYVRRSDFDQFKPSNDLLA